MNQWVIGKKVEVIKPMDTSTTPIGIILGLAIDLFRRFPQGISEWCYRILCGLFAVFLVAPFVLSILANYSIGANQTVEPLVYCLTVLFAEPTITFIIRFFEIVLPKWVERKVNVSTTDEEN